MGSTHRRQHILNVALGYGIAAAVWIAVSDWMVASVVHDADTLLLINSVKGWLFVAVTSILLWVVLQRLVRRYDLQVTRERRTSERQLRDSEARYRMLFDANPYPMWLYDLSSLKFLAVNDAAVEVYGYSREEFLGMSIFDIRSPDEAARLASHLGRLKSQQAVAASRRGVWRHVRKSGESFDADVISTPMPMADASARLVIARDVTQEVHSAKALQDSEQLLSDLTRRLLEQERETSRRFAQALHDQLGQSLVVCKLLVETAVETVDVDAGQRNRALHQATAQLEVATRWVREMLLELQPANLEEVGLIQALRSEVSLFGAMSKGPTLTLEMPETLEGCRWPTHAENAAFMVTREALANVVQHAQATCAKVRITGAAGQMTVEVIDNGLGIALESGQDLTGHLGLVGMRLRAERVGAALMIERVAEGGTRVMFSWRECS